MKTISISILLVMITGTLAHSQNIIWNETPEQREERMQWWTDARFGMFIHWGQEGLAAENDLNLRLPVIKPNVEIPVIELILK